VIAANSSQIKVYSGDTGALEWSDSWTYEYKPKELFVSDLYGDGNYYIIVGSRATIFVYNSSGDLEWRVSNLGNYSNEEIFRNLIGGDVDDDGKVEIVGYNKMQNSSGGVRYAMNYLENNGNLIDRFVVEISSASVNDPLESREHKHLNLDLGDLNNDGVNDILSNFPSDSPIDGSSYLYAFQTVSCNISFNDSVSGTLNWNESSMLWEYNRSFIDAEFYSYNITCFKGGYETNVSSGVISIGQNEPPVVEFVFSTPDNNTWTNGTRSYFNVSVNDLEDQNNISSFVDWNNSLLAWYRFAESGGNFVNDSSSHGNDGVLYGNPLRVLGVLGKGLDFDGVNDYVNVSSFSDNPGMSSYTVDFWLRRPPAEGGGQPISKGVDASGWLFRANSGDKRFYFNAGDGVNYGIVLETVPYSNDSLWHHFVGVIDRNNNQLRLYRDAVYQMNASLSSVGSISSSNTLYLGVGTLTGTNTPNIPNAVWNGSIDDVKIHKRALTLEEIKASYNSGLYRLESNINNLSEGNHTYLAYAQDLAGNLNETEVRNLFVDFVKPQIQFVAPTRDNNSFLNSSNNWNYVNVSVNDDRSSNMTSFIDWDNSLRAWWRFEEGSGQHTYDSSKFGNTCNFGSLIGFPRNDPHWVYSGKFGKGLFFDGENDTLSCGNDSSLNPTNEITVEAWVKPNLDPEYGRIVERGFAQPGSWILTKTNANDFRFIVVDSLGNQKPARSLLTYDNYIGKWTHLVGTYEGNERRLYVNGRLQNHTNDLSYVMTEPLGNYYPVDSYVNKCAPWY